MRVLVTGGAGFIGSHLLDRLVEGGRWAVCLDNFDDLYSPQVKRANIADALASGRVELVEGDIRDAELCRSLLARDDVRAVVHLAARAGVRPSIEQPALYQQVNCEGTVNLLEAARLAHGVEKFIFGSSSSVYGINSKIPFSEDDPIAQPISPYAATKRAGELLCHVYHHLYGLPVVCLRFFTVYGPRQRPDLAIHKFTRLIANGEPIPVYGDGTSRRDYTYYSDVVDGIMAALEAPLDFEIINLGNSEPVELHRLIELIEECLGREARIERLPDQPGDVPVTYADISKARRLLGYEPRFPIGQGIADFVEWFSRTCRRGA
ncbi:MAG: GDP-mannose 4,6-dehydratase [Candidatus Brocadiae bacterium]|nr:GDP-mannose 4,6-dehydratase [Candidatus Brocadiia bacterium]